MQSHQLTLGRNIQRTIDAVNVESAIRTFYHFLQRYDCHCFSVYEGKGYWCGIPENTIKFEVFGITDYQAKELSARLAKEYSQDAVMLLSVNARPKFVCPDLNCL